MFIVKSRALTANRPGEYTLSYLQHKRDMYATLKHKSVQKIAQLYDLGINIVALHLNKESVSFEAKRIQFYLNLKLLKHHGTLNPETGRPYTQGQLAYKVSKKPETVAQM